MIVSKELLQKLIDEEFARAVSSRKKKINEVGLRRGSLATVDPYELIAFAKQFASLGAAVTEQLEELMNDPDAQVNSAAVRMMRERLGGKNDGLDEVLKQWEDYRHDAELSDRLSGLEDE